MPYTKSLPLLTNINVVDAHFIRRFMDADSITC